MKKIMATRTVSASLVELAAVPEPASLALLLAGIGSLAGVGMRRRRA